MSKPRILASFSLTTLLACTGDPLIEPSTTDTGSGTDTGTTAKTTSDPTTGATTTASTTSTTGTATEPTTGDNTTGEPDSVCGDGHKDDGEACDNGAQNGDDQACTAGCMLNVCGDGKLGPGESCDDGNQVDNDSCSNACKPKTCGDGIKQVPEQCDLGVMNSNTGACTLACLNAKCGDTFVWSGKEQCDDGNVVGNDGCNANCTKPKLVFVTSGSWNGNLGGLTGGDGKCQTLANAAALGGTYKAWLSNNTNNPQSRFVKSTTGYALVNGKDVAKTWADLVDGSILLPINVNEKNAAVGQADVWTGTSSNGTSLEEDCSGWFASGGLLVIGYEGRNNATNGNWTNTGLLNASNCSTVQRLYCFQQ